MDSEARDSRFYRRARNELRGDAYDVWGTATYYFWVLDGVVEQQVEVYENGTILAYDRYHTEDDYGFMTGEALEPAEEWDGYRVDIETYQREVEGQPFNRRG